MPTITDVPHCEICDKEVGIRVGQDFTWKIATFDKKERMFHILESQKYLFSENGKSHPFPRQTCTREHGVKACKPGQFILLIDEGDIVGAIDSWDHNGNQLGKFWENKQ